MPKRLYSILKTCQRTVGLPRNMPKNIKFASYSMYTMSSQRPYSVHVASMAQAVAAACSWRAHSVLMARPAFSRRL